MEDTSYADLFGDDTMDNIESMDLQTMTAPVQVKGLASRIDDLRASGCCEKLAWSKNGCVARISPDGYTINLTAFARDAETGKWDLQKDVPLEVPRGRDEYPFVHLSWSHLGNDLAVMDAVGRVMVFSCAMALDRMTHIRTEVAQSEAEVDGVVGMHWLAIHPYEAKNHIAWSTTREGNKWKWNMKSHHFNDAFHPVDGKASLMYLKRHGELKLRFQQNDSTWQEVTTQVGPILSTREPFTHAAFASNNDSSLLLAAYDVMRKLHLYRVETSWNVPPEKRVASAGPFEKPSLQVSLISIEDDCSLAALVDSDMINGGDPTGVASAQITHLNFLPTTPEQDDGLLPTIQAIFCHPPNLISFDQLQPQENPHSILVRWEVVPVQQTQLHPSLDQVTSKKKSVGSVASKATFKLKRLPDYTLPSLVLSTWPLWYNMLLGFSYSDGNIEIRQRSTMEVVRPDGSNDTMTSLLQAGFVFPKAEPSLHVAFSPNHCIAVCMQQDSTVKLLQSVYQHGDLSEDGDDPRDSAALAALVLQSASAANQYFSSDDIFSITGPLSEKRKNDFINLLFDGLSVNIDCGVDDSSNQHLLLLGRSPFFVKTLSAMNLLGIQGKNNRSLTSKMAWIVLNIKYVTQILTTITRMHGPLEKTSLRPEVVPQFIGICRWIMHFMAYLLDQLFTLGRAVHDLDSADLNKAVLEQKISKLNNPAVLLLLSAFPRAMMQLWAKPLAWVKRSAESIVAPSQPIQAPEIRKLYSPLNQAVNEVPFDWRWFEMLMQDTHSLARGAYKRANLSDTQRNHCERELMLGRVPEVLFPVAKRLVTDTLWNEKIQGGCLADKLDTGRLMFFDTMWLGFQESKRAEQWHNTHVVDVCQKMIIRGIGKQEHPSATGQPLKRGRSDSIQSTAERAAKRQLRMCTRCGACMEDVVQGLPGYTPHHASWLMGVAKHCVCGNSWILADEKRVMK